MLIRVIFTHTYRSRAILIPYFINYASNHIHAHFFFLIKLSRGCIMLHGLKTINLIVTLYLYQLPIYGQ